MINDDSRKSNGIVLKMFPGTGDVKTASGLILRDFVNYSFALAACICLCMLLAGCAGSDTGIQATSYPIDSTVYTTLQKTVKLDTTSGAILPQNLQNISQYDANGYGVWIDGGPLVSDPRPDIMLNGSYTLPSPNKPLKLLRFFSISDIHIMDKESPAQVIYLQQLQYTPPISTSIGEYPWAAVTSAYTPNMMYTTHVLDAAIQTVNTLHKINPIDFGISLGDTCNSTQYNELRWYIDVLDGKVITPSSGAHVGADTVDYQKPYKAAGLNPAIPWYQAIGNHDQFFIGSIPVDAGGVRKAYVSDEVIALTDVLLNAGNLYGSLDTPDSPKKYYMGVIDGSTETGTIIKAGKVGDPGFTTPPKVVPDPNRRSLTKAQWKKEFFNTSKNPVGHGFNLVSANQADDFVSYSFVPKSNIPIKVIVLDDTQREDDGNVGIHGRGFLDQARWAWLKSELAAGDAAGQLMIIAAHVPIGVMPYASATQPDTFMDWYDNSANPSGMQNAVTLPNLLAELHNHPNLLMWIAGHRHINTVKAFLTDDPAKPERGFWQVETSSLLDFPQQLRTFEINLNSDYTISIITTNVDPAVREGTPAWTARKYAVAALQIIKRNCNTNLPGADPTLVDQTLPDPSIKVMDANICSYNAELFKQLSPAMKTKMQTLHPVW